MSVLVRYLGWVNIFSSAQAKFTQQSFLLLDFSAPGPGTTAFPLSVLAVETAEPERSQVCSSGQREGLFLGSSLLISSHAKTLPFQSGVW